MTSPETSTERPLCVLSFESRRADEMRSLIARHGATPTVAPSMQEVPLADNDAVFRFGEELLAGRVDVVVFLTGVGCEATLDALETRWSMSDVLPCLEQARVVVRGPKPSAVLKKRGVRVDIKAAEPNTWRDVVTAMQQAIELKGRTVAVQEYGKPNAALYEELRRLGAAVLPVPVYCWTLPDDVGPLEAALRTAVTDGFDVYAFTSAQQLDHVLMVADRLGLTASLRAAMQASVIASIGPTCSEALREAGFEPDLEASPPKMGQLIRMAVQEGRDVLARKSGSA